MSNGIILAGLPLWKRRSELFLNILREALELLPGKDSAENETALNRELLLCIEEVYQSRVERSLEIPDFLPVSDAPNPPLRPERTSAERMKPDIRWDLVDHEAGKGIAIRPFAVECKRLRTPTKSWNYNREYVVSGIARFASPKHRYGEHSDRGAMVGYWQGMKYRDIIANINKHLSGAGLPEISLGAGRLLESNQLLEREFPVSPYRLTHLIVDVRRTRVLTRSSRETRNPSIGAAETLTGLTNASEEAPLTLWISTIAKLVP